MKELRLIIKTITLFLFFWLPSTTLSPFFGSTKSHILELHRQNQRIENIIFDLGGVLLNNSKKNMIINVGIAKFFMYVASLNNPLNIEKKLFDFLHKIKPLDPKTPKTYSPNGKSLLPQLAVDWLSGYNSCKTIKNIIISHINNHPEICKSKSERSLLLKMLDFYSPTTVPPSYPTVQTLLTKLRVRGNTLNQ